MFDEYDDDILDKEIGHSGYRSVTIILPGRPDDLCNRLRIVIKVKQAGNIP